MNVFVWFPLAFAAMGYLFSSRPVLLFMNTLNPLQGLVVYYVIIFMTLEVLQLFGLIIGGVPMASLRQTLGEVMIIFAYFVIVDWESAWVQDVVAEDRKRRGVPVHTSDDKSTTLGNQALECPNVYLQAEDGAVYYLMNTYVSANKEVARILSFVVVPAVLAFVGLYLTRGVVKRSMF